MRYHHSLSAPPLPRVCVDVAPSQVTAVVCDAVEGDSLRSNESSVGDWGGMLSYVFLREAKTMKKWTKNGGTVTS